MTDIEWASNQNISDYNALGPVPQTILVTLYSISSLLAFTGNGLVILVELYGRRSARNLRKFLINLAISDILFGVLSVPFTYTDFMLGRWIFPHWLCPAAQFTQVLSFGVSIYTLTFIGIERYFATLHPLSTANRWLRSHCNLVLMMGWIFASILAYTPMQNTFLQSIENPNSTEVLYDCQHQKSSDHLYLIGSFMITFVLPLIFMTYSYCAIGARLLHTQRKWASFPYMSGSISANLGSSSIGNGRQENDRSGSLTSDQDRTQHHQQQHQLNGNAPKATKSNSFPGMFNRCGSNKSISTKPKRTPKMSLTSNQSIDSGMATPVVKGHSTTTVKIYCNDAQSKQQIGGETGSLVSNGKSRFHCRNTEIVNKMRVFRLLVAVLIFFIICWLPIKLFYMVIELWLTNPETGDLAIIPAKLNVYVGTYFFCHLLAVSNSFINPIIYCFMSKSFRADLVDVFVFVLEKFNVRTKLNVGRTSIPQIELKYRRRGGTREHAQQSKLYHVRTQAAKQHQSTNNGCQQYTHHRHNYRVGHTHQHFTFNRNISLNTLPPEVSQDLNSNVPQLDETVRVVSEIDGEIVSMLSEAAVTNEKSSISQDFSCNLRSLSHTESSEKNLVF